MRIFNMRSTFVFLIAFLTFSFSSAQDGQPIDADALAEAIKEIMHVQIDEEVTKLKKSGVSVDKIPVSVEVEYRNDRVHAINIVSTKPVAIKVIQFEYGNVGALKNVPIAIFSNSGRTDLSFFWKNLLTAFSNYLKSQDGIQMTMQLDGIQPAGANINRDQVQRAISELQKAVAPNLNQLAETIANVVVEGFTIERITKAEGAAARSAQISFNFEDESKTKLVAIDTPAAQTDAVKTQAERDAEWEKQYLRRSNMRAISKLVTVTYWLAAVSFVGHGFYQLFTATSDSYHILGPIWSLKSHITIGLSMMLAGLINGIPVFFDDFGVRLGRSYGYLSFTELIYDQVINFRTYAAERKKQRDLKRGQLEVEKSRANELSKVSLLQNIGAIEINLSEGEIQKVKADAIIVPQFRDANSFRNGGDGTAVYTAGAKSGMQAYDDIVESRLKNVPFGTAYMFPSGGGLSDYVIHITSVWSARFIPQEQEPRRQAYEIEILKESLREAIRVAVVNPAIKSLSIPALGTEPLGTLKNQPNLSAALILEVIKEMRSVLEASQIRRVELVAYGQDTFKAFHGVFARVFGESARPRTSNDLPPSLDSRFKMCSSLF